VCGGVIKIVIRAAKPAQKSEISYGNTKVNQPGLPREPPGARVRIAALCHTSPERPHTMDVEHINAIANALIDLSQRTVDLRGYL
jgi:hypothetical protein